MQLQGMGCDQDLVLSLKFPRGDFKRILTWIFAVIGIEQKANIRVSRTFNLLVFH